MRIDDVCFVIFQTVIAFVDILNLPTNMETLPAEQDQYMAVLTYGASCLTWKYLLGCQSPFRFICLIQQSLNNRSDSQEAVSTGTEGNVEKRQVVFHLVSSSCGFISVFVVS